MSDDVRKKEAEIKILKRVFGENIDYEESEQPDFILKYGENVKHGVEITELYYDGVSARIKNERYIQELLEERKHWHKDDKKKLKVHDITYYSQEKSYLPIELPALFLPKYNLRDYVKSVKQTIESKNEKLKKYCSDISKYCMLVIYDKENPFEKLHEKDIAGKLFSAGLSKVVRESNYREIYLITEIESKSRYIPLKAYLLQSDFLLFIEFVRERNLINRLEEKNKSLLFAFAEILKRRGNTVTFGEVDHDEVMGKIVAYNGKYGIGITINEDDNWGVGLFDTYPLQKIPNTVVFELEPNSGFFDDDLYKDYEEMVQKRIASIGMFFLTK